MFTEVLSQVTGLLDRRYIFTFFLTSLLFWGLLLAVFVAGGQGLSGAVADWDAQPETSKVLQAVGFVAWVTFSSAMLSALSTDLLRLYEGYTSFPWNVPLLRRLRAAGRRYHQARLEILSEQADNPQAQETIYYKYPPLPRRDEVMPTLLGNILKNSEVYPIDRYGANAVLLWPRLYDLLPDSFAQAIDAARGQLDLMITISTLAAAFALVSGSYLVWQDAQWWLFVLCFLGGFVTSWAAYRGALANAVPYGMQIKSAFDLYRNQLLEQMRLDPPETQAEEEVRWHQVNAFLYTGVLESPDLWAYREGAPSAPTAEAAISEPEARQAARNASLQAARAASQAATRARTLLPLLPATDESLKSAVSAATQAAAQVAAQVAEQAARQAAADASHQTALEAARRLLQRGEADDAAWDTVQAAVLRALNAAQTEAARTATEDAARRAIARTAQRVIQGRAQTAAQAAAEAAANPAQQNAYQRGLAARAAMRQSIEAAGRAAVEAAVLAAARAASIEVRRAARRAAIEAAPPIAEQADLSVLVWAAARVAAQTLREAAHRAATAALNHGTARAADDVASSVFRLDPVGMALDAATGTATVDQMRAAAEPAMEAVAELAISKVAAKASRLAAETAVRATLQPAVQSAVQDAVQNAVQEVQATMELVSGPAAQAARQAAAGQATQVAAQAAEGAIAAQAAALVAGQTDQARERTAQEAAIRVVMAHTMQAVDQAAESAAGAQPVQDAVQDVAHSGPRRGLQKLSRTLGRWRLRNWPVSNRTAAAVALGTIGGLAVLAWRDTTGVPVDAPRTTLPAYHLITSADLTRIKLPPRSVPPGVVAGSSGLVGRYTLTEARSRNPLRASQLGPPVQTASISNTVPIQITSSGLTNLSGVLKAGDTVNVFLVPASAKPGALTPPKEFSNVLALDVKGGPGGKGEKSTTGGPLTVVVALPASRLQDFAARSRGATFLVTPAR